MQREGPTNVLMFSMNIHPIDPKSPKTLVGPSLDHKIYGVKTLIFKVLNSLWIMRSLSFILVVKNTRSKRFKLWKIPKKIHLDTRWSALQSDHRSSIALPYPQIKRYKDESKKNGVNWPSCHQKSSKSSFPAGQHQIMVDCLVLHRFRPFFSHRIVGYVSAMRIPSGDCGGMGNRRRRRRPFGHGFHRATIMGAMGSERSRTIIRS